MENSSQKQCLPTLDEAIAQEMKDGSINLNDPRIDLKKIRRNVSNRLSAQRSRMKMVNHTRDSEKMVKDLEAHISTLTPQVESYKERKNLLQIENDTLQRELEKSSNKSSRHELEIEEMRSEINMLKELQKTAQHNKHEARQIPPDFRLEPLLEYEDVDQYINFDALDTAENPSV